MTRCKWKKCAVILNCMTSCFVQEPADKTESITAFVFHLTDAYNHDIMVAHITACLLLSVSSFLFCS